VRRRAAAADLSAAMSLRVDASVATRLAEHETRGGPAGARGWLVGPADRAPGDAVVIGTGDQTFFGKTAKLIAGVEEIGHFEKILYKITAFLLLVSLVLTGIIMGVLLYNETPFLETIAICVVLLVASIPIAMNVVCTSTMAIGSRKLAMGGAIVTRLGSIEELAGMDMLCSDKTGTLTLGKMKMKDILVYEDGLTSREILKFSALAAKWYEPAKDAIDKLVLGDVENTDGLMAELDTYTQLDYTPFDPRYV